MTENKWSEYQQLVLTSLEKLDERVNRLENRTIGIEKSMARISTENKIILSSLLLLFGGLISLAFKVLSK